MDKPISYKKVNTRGVLGLKLVLTDCFDADQRRSRRVQIVMKERERNAKLRKRTEALFKWDQLLKLAREKLFLFGFKFFSILNFFYWTIPKICG